MGSLHSLYGRNKNVFEGTIGRNEAGEITVDLGRWLKNLDPSMRKSPQATDLIKALGTGPVREADLKNYSATYHGTTGGDADQAYTYTWKPIDKAQKGAYGLAVDLFKIKEQGEKDSARIAQEGRDKARQTNFGAELDSVNRRALAASEDSAREQVGGTPDVVLSSDTDADDASAGPGGDARRRRSSFFPGGGLRI